VSRTGTGAGRPGGPGSPDGPDAPDYPAVAAARAADLAQLDAALVDCRACPRLVEWREEVGRTKRRMYRSWDYWARPVPGFGPADAPLALVGLAPAAHGGNRTGRAFTGDPSGDTLYAALYDLGLASRPVSERTGDGLELRGVRISMPVHCAPPDNRPTTGERDTCRPWQARELELLRPTLRAAVVLGGFAWQALLPQLAAAGWRIPRPRPVFGHGAEAVLSDGERRLHLIGSYHPSNRNMQTRTLTPAMLRDALRRGALAAGLPVRASDEPPAADARSAGTPAVGAPAGGTPAVGTPAAGIPAVGTPAVGTPNDSVAEVRAGTRAPGATGGGASGPEPDAPRGLSGPGARP
jgi:uracil-DNA glycosylase family 4